MFVTMDTSAVSWKYHRLWLNDENCILLLRLIFEEQNGVSGQAGVRPYIPAWVVFLVSEMMHCHGFRNQDGLGCKILS